MALLESSFLGQLSFNIKTALADKYLFSETQSRFIVSVPESQVVTFEQLAGQKATLLGQVTNTDEMMLTTATQQIILSRQETQKVYQESISWKLKA